MVNREAFFTWLEKQNTVSLLQKAIQCNTVNPPGNEAALASEIQHILDSYGIESELFPEPSGRANLIARIRGGKPGKRLVFSGHLDTVPIGETPWNVPPFSGECIDGRIYGRGTSDMKGGLYSLLFAFVYLHTTKEEWRGECLLAASFGEETGGEGARLMMQEKQLPPYDAMIIAEPTGNKLMIAHKGVLWVKIRCYGKNAHASAPSQGVNAIELAQELSNRLQHSELKAMTHPLLSNTTFTVTTIQAGKKANVIPDYCEMTLDIRTIPTVTHDTVLQYLENAATDIASSHPFSRIEVETLLDLPSIATPAESLIVRTARHVLSENGCSDVIPGGMNYFTDGSVFSAYHSGDILILGPGKPELAHQTDEYIEVEEYHKAIQMFYEIASTYLQENESHSSLLVHEKGEIS